MTPGGGLQGTGRWYVSGDVWFEVDETTIGGETRFEVFRCYVAPDMDAETDESDTCGSYRTHGEAVAAIQCMVVEEMAALTAEHQPGHAARTKE